VNHFTLTFRRGHEEELQAKMGALHALIRETSRAVLPPHGEPHRNREARQKSNQYTGQVGEGCQQHDRRERPVQWGKRLCPNTPVVTTQTRSSRKPVFPAAVGTQKLDYFPGPEDDGGRRKMARLKASETNQSQRFGNRYVRS
jgi:hypothetical protein